MVHILTLNVKRFSIICFQFYVNYIITLHSVMNWVKLVAAFVRDICCLMYVFVILYYLMIDLPFSAGSIYTGSINMPRKRRRNDEDDLSTEFREIVLVHNAQRASKINTREPLTLDTVKSKYQIKRHGDRTYATWKWYAKKVVKEWKNSPDGSSSSMAFGTARFIKSAFIQQSDVERGTEEDYRSIIQALGLDSIVESVLLLHDERYCELGCTTETHVNNRIVQRASIADEAEIECLSSAGDASFSVDFVNAVDLFNQQEHIIIDNNDVIGSEEAINPIEETAVDEGVEPLPDACDDIDIPAAPGGDQLPTNFDNGPDDILQKLVQRGPFTEDQILLLSGRGASTAASSSETKNKNPAIPIRQLTAHWAVRWGLTSEAMTDFCGLFKTYHPDVFKELPDTGRSLMGATAPTGLLPRAIHGPTPKGIKGEVGEYMHFGIAAGILGTSIGTVHWHEHVTQLRRLHLICPEMLPQIFLDNIRPRNGDDFEKHKERDWNFRAFHPDDTTEPVCVKIHVNIDGVQWFQNSKTKGVPILGRIHSIENSTRCIKFPKPGKPFIIGVLKQSSKCDVQDFISDFINELRELKKPTESRNFSVELACMICDAPQRCELKGIISNAHIIYTNRKIMLFF